MSSLSLSALFGVRNAFVREKSITSGYMNTVQCTLYSTTQNDNTQVKWDGKCFFAVGSLREENIISNLFHF